MKRFQTGPGSLPGPVWTRGLPPSDLPLAEVLGNQKNDSDGTPKK